MTHQPPVTQTNKSTQSKFDPYLWACEVSLPPRSGRLSSSSRTQLLLFPKGDWEMPCFFVFIKLPPDKYKPAYYCNPATLLFLDYWLGLYPFCFFFVFSAPFLGRALLSGCISARNICLFRAISGGSAPLLLAKMCQLFLFLYLPARFLLVVWFLLAMCSRYQLFCSMYSACGRGFPSVHNFTVHVLGV